MLSKAEKFCDYAIEETHAGKISPKAFFRRGRVRMLAGRCADADSDFDVALGLLPPPPMIPSDDGDAGGGGIGGGGGASSSSDGAGGEAERSMRAVVMREKRRLRSLVARAERDGRAQKRAMERLFGGSSSSSSSSSIGDGGDDGNDVIAPGRTTSRGLYPEKRDIVRRLTPRNNGHRNKDTSYDDDDDDDDDDDCDDDCDRQQRPSCVRWYMRAMGRCAQKLLDLVGDEEEGEYGSEGAPLSYQQRDLDIISSMEGKKNA
jgi:hypothetical protein